MEGDPRYEASQDVPDFPYAEYAKMLGLSGIKIDKPEDIVPSLEFAFTLNKPVVLEFYTDPNVPLLPPHISFKEAKSFTSSLFKDPDTWDIIKQTWKETVKTYYHTDAK
jgi:pyruvate dehydrogenase (quinone)